MDSLYQIIERLTATIHADVLLRACNQQFQHSLAQYTLALSASIQRYQHHQNFSIGDGELKARFLYETALLHTLTHVLTFAASQQNTEINITWPLKEPVSCFNWYKLPRKLTKTIEEAIAGCVSIVDFALEISQISGSLLDKSSTRYVGEFYTPLSLAKHLVKLSGLADGDVLSDRTLVDPACGGGIILVLIVNRAIRYAIDHQCSPVEVVRAVSKNISGFDIQPFAIALTKSLLLFECAPLLAKIDDLGEEILFPNIKLVDPLASHHHYWNLSPGFNFVVGNPPYLPVKRPNIDYIEYYDVIINGHVNLYALFVWWAIQAASPDGVISFLLPQSLLSGYYFKKLRDELQRKTIPLALTRMTDRKGVVGDADQQIMAVSLKAISNVSSDTYVDVIVTHNGVDIDQCQSQQILRSSIIRDVKGSIIWITSDDSVDYEIAESVEATLGVLGDFQNQLPCKNGGFVWNQHKELILSEQKRNSIPLLTSAAIEPFIFTFPYQPSHPLHKRAFAEVNSKVSSEIRSGTALLIQRVTPRKIGRRLSVALTSDEFNLDHPQYFIENHVNSITSENVDLLHGLLGWLNSDLINFIFQMRNGSAQASVFELQALPVSIPLLQELSEVSKAIASADVNKRVTHINTLNDFIFRRFELNDQHRARILKVLERKEKTKLGDRQ